MRRPTPEQPEPGQESVWDYPRPPRVEPTSELVEVVLGGVTVARTREALRLLETSHPPAYYLPRSCWVEDSLRPGHGRSWCEWKGLASYFDVIGGDRVAEHAAWTYPRPRRSYAVLADHVAVYPALMDRCTVDGEEVRPQPGRFYGGWITSRVVGPFKGEPGSVGW